MPMTWSATWCCKPELRSDFRSNRFGAENLFDNASGGLEHRLRADRPWRETYESPPASNLPHEDRYANKHKPLQTIRAFDRKRWPAIVYCPPKSSRLNHSRGAPTPEALGLLLGPGPT